MYSPFLSHWDGAGNWNPFSSKTMACLSCILNAVSVDDMISQAQNGKMLSGLSLQKHNTFKIFQKCLVYELTMTWYGSHALVPNRLPAISNHPPCLMNYKYCYSSLSMVIADSLEPIWHQCICTNPITQSNQSRSRESGSSALTLRFLCNWMVRFLAILKHYFVKVIYHDLRRHTNARNVIIHKM